MNHLLHGRPGDGVTGLPGFRVDILRTQPQILVKQHVGIGVHPVELLPQPCCDHHRKFQALAFVNAHNAYHIFIFTQNPGRSHVAAAVLQLVNKPDKPKKSLDGSLLKLMGPIQQDPQIGLPLFSAGHGPHIGIIAGFRIKLPDKVLHGKIEGCQLPLGDVPIKVPQLPGQAVFLCRRIFRGGLPEKPLPAAGPDPDQIVCTESSDGRAQNGQQGDVLAFIVDELQQGDHRFHLKGFKITGVHIRIDRDPRCRKHLLKNGGPSHRASHQNHDIPIIHRPDPLAALFARRRKICSNQTPDPLRGDSRLHFNVTQAFRVRVRILLCRLRLFHQMKLHFRIRQIFRVQTRIKGGGIVIIHLPELRGHNIPEQIIDGM